MILHWNIYLKFANWKAVGFTMLPHSDHPSYLISWWHLCYREENWQSNNKKILVHQHLPSQDITTDTTMASYGRPSLVDCRKMTIN